MNLQQTIDNSLKEFDKEFKITELYMPTIPVYWVKDFITSSIKKAVEEAYEQAEEIVATEMDYLSVKTTNAEFVACDELAINIINKLRQKYEIHKS